MCEHNYSPFQNIGVDLFTVVGLVLLFFICRELFAWFCKGNHILGGVKENRSRLLRIEEMLTVLTA